MSYFLDDRDAFLRAERDWLTPPDEEPVYGAPVTCDECEETHPSDDYAAEDGWTVVHTDDCDVVLCPGHTAAVAAQDAADIASGAYSDAPGMPADLDAWRAASIAAAAGYVANAPCDGCGLPRGAHSDAALAGCEAAL